MAYALIVSVQDRLRHVPVTAPGVATPCHKAPAGKHRVKACQRLERAIEVLGGVLPLDSVADTSDRASTRSELGALCFKKPSTSGLTGSAYSILFCA